MYGILHTWGLYKPRVCAGASQKGPQITAKIEKFYKTSVNNETRMNLRHTWLWRRRNQQSKSLKWQSWPRREKVPLLCSATENDTNEGPGSYLSPNMCHLWHFFPLYHPNCHHFSCTLIIFTLLYSLLGWVSIYEPHFWKFRLLKH